MNAGCLPRRTLLEPTPPSEKTLRKYGLTADDWRALLKRQGGVCAICKTVPLSGRLVIDHEHVPGWAKKPPHERKKYVRGLLCVFDNYRTVGRGATAYKLTNAAAYLRRYDRRKK